MPVFKKSGGYKGGGHKGGFTRGGGAPKHEFFSATCSSCGKACEVPFRPTGERPVFCRDCFGSRDVSKKDFSAPPARSNYAPRTTEPNTDMARQLDAMNKKLDTLIRIVESLAE